jgi:hypothetical protein
VYIVGKIQLVKILSGWYLDDVIDKTVDNTIVAECKSKIYSTLCLYYSEYEYMLMSHDAEFYVVAW